MVQAGLKPGLFKMGTEQVWYGFKKDLRIEKLRKVFGAWSICDLWQYIPEIDEAFVHVVEDDGEKWFFNNGLLKWHKPGAKKPEYYSWSIVAGAIKLSKPDPSIELGGMY